MVLSLRVELKDTPPPSETAEQREARRDKEMAWMLEALNNMNHLLRNHVYGEHRSMTPSGFSTPPAVPPPPVHTPATVTENAEPSRNERVSFALPRASERILPSPPRVSEEILPSPPLAADQEKKQELQQSQESSDDDLMPMKNTEISLGNFVEQVVGVSSQEVSHDVWTSKVPIPAQNLRQRRIAVKRSYHKARKRLMKKDHRSKSLHLAFQVRSPRNQLYLGEDRFNSMAVNMVDENQNAGTRRARFKQRFKQFQKRRSRERYRVVISSFRLKHNSWVVTKKKEKISSHTFSFPPLNRLTVSDDDVLSQTDSILTFDKEFLKLSSLAKEVCKLSGVIAKHDDGVLSSVIAMKNDSELLLDKSVASVNSLSFEVGTEENMSSGLSQTSQVWEPGGILANGTRGSHTLQSVYELQERQIFSSVKEWLVGTKERLHAYANISEGTTTKIHPLVLEAEFANMVKAQVESNSGKRLSDFSLVWKPVGVLAEHVLGDWLVDFYGYDGIVDEIRCLAVGVCSGNKQPIDSGRANRVWERGGLVKCDKRFEVLRLIQRLHKIGLQGNETEVLIKWKGLPEFEATWEPVTVMLEQFSDFNLEDKVASLPPGIDK